MTNLTWSMEHLHGDDPNPPSRKRARANDDSRQDSEGRRLVHNPFWHSSVCVVCWAGITVQDRADPGRLRRKQKPTSFYCRECSLEQHWTYRVRIGKSFHRYHPRLCSERCFKIFHTREIFGLDHHQRSRRQQRRSPRQPRRNVVRTPQPVRRNNNDPLNVRFDA